MTMTMSRFTLQNGFRHGVPALQRGVVLVMALIFLLLITILAVSASGTSLLQEKMVGATRNGQLADWAAESTLRGVEWRLFQSATVVGGRILCTPTAISDDGCVRYNNYGQPYSATGAVTQFRTDGGWTGTLGTPYQNPAFLFTDPHAAYSANAFKTAGVAEDPRFLIEDLGPVRPPGTGMAQETGTTGTRSGGTGKIDIRVYRITARATGASKNVVRAMQSTFDAQTAN